MENTKENTMEEVYLLSSFSIGSNVFIISKGEVSRAMEIKTKSALKVSINPSLKTLVDVLVRP